MGWKGALRSMAAASRRAAREQERYARQQHRALEVRRKQSSRLAELERAALEVEWFENQVALLTSVHKECSPPQDWVMWLNRPKPMIVPLAPERGTRFEDEAKAALNAYQPSMTEKLLRLDKRRRAALESTVEEARERDRSSFEHLQTQYSSKLQRFQNEQSEWEEMVGLAGKVVEGDGKAWVDVIQSLGIFEEVAGLGSEVRLSVRDNGAIVATVVVHGSGAIPKEEMRLTTTGKISVKTMPAQRFWALYQDHVCGAVLRVARELFAAVPVKQVLVTAVTDMLNPTNGQMEEASILSVYLPRETTEKLNWERVDPSDALSNFVHRMAFKGTKGFAKIETLTIEAFA
jgi:hypothetical protein